MSYLVRLNNKFEKLNGTGEWAWGDGTYDGAFTLGSFLNLFYDNDHSNLSNGLVTMDSLPLSTIALTKAWVEEYGAAELLFASPNYQGLNVGPSIGL